MKKFLTSILSLGLAASMLITGNTVRASEEAFEHTSPEEFGFIVDEDGGIYEDKNNPANALLIDTGFIEKNANEVYNESIKLFNKNDIIGYFECDRRVDGTISVLDGDKVLSSYEMCKDLWMWSGHAWISILYICSPSESNGIDTSELTVRYQFNEDYCARLSANQFFYSRNNFMWHPGGGIPYPYYGYDKLPYMLVTPYPEPDPEIPTLDRENLIAVNKQELEERTFDVANIDSFTLNKKNQPVLKLSGHKEHSEGYIVGIYNVKTGELEYGLKTTKNTVTGKKVSGDGLYVARASCYKIGEDIWGEKEYWYGKWSPLKYAISGTKLDMGSVSVSRKKNVKIEWSSIEKANKYAIYYSKKKNSGYKKYKTVTKTKMSFPYKVIKSGYKYFSVRPVAVVNGEEIESSGKSYNYSYLGNLEVEKTHEKAYHVLK